MIKITTLALFAIFAFNSCGKKKNNNVTEKESPKYNLNCKNYNKDNLSNSSKYIINGKPTTSNTAGAESTVNLRINFSKDKFICSGVVIGQRSVLTAAHCGFNINNMDEKISHFDLFVNNGIVNTPIVQTSSSYYIHPLYSRTQNELSETEKNVFLPMADLMIVSFDRDLNLPVVPISSNWKNGDELISIGYGHRSIVDESLIGDKYYTSSRIINYKDDIKYLEKEKQFFREAIATGKINKDFNGDIKNTFIVMKKINSNDGITCFGDSGGPQFIVGDKNKPRLISITQGFHGRLHLVEYYNKTNKMNLETCKNSEALNTLVAPYSEWIYKVLQKDNDMLQCEE